MLWALKVAFHKLGTTLTMILFIDFRDLMKSYFGSRKEILDDAYILLLQWLDL